MVSTKKRVIKEKKKQIFKMYYKEINKKKKEIEKKRNKTTKQTKQLKKEILNHYLLTMTLVINELILPIKRDKIA